MTVFTQVTVAKAANIYFDGKVTSRKITFADSSVKTLGIMMPGDYEFSTAEKELMEITAGEVEVLLPKQNAWKTIVSGQFFEVPANATFHIKVHTLTDYCCSYLSE